MVFNSIKNWKSAADIFPVFVACPCCCINYYYWCCFNVKPFKVLHTLYLLKVVHKNSEITGWQFSKPSFNTKSFPLKIMPEKFRTFCLFSKHLCLRLNSCITDSNVMKVVKLLNVLNTNSLLINGLYVSLCKGKFILTKRQHIY